MYKMTPQRGPLAAIIVVALSLSAAADPATSLVAHEWGTFTSFQGFDGVMLEFSTIPKKDLPGFVYTPESATKVDRERNPNRYEGKMRRSLQRMETPVVYFYADKPMKVATSVKFPKGLLTEFYPLPRYFGPRAGTNATTGGYLNWDKFRIIPQDHPEAADIKLPGLKKGDDPKLANHYMYARDTDSAFVRFCDQDLDPSHTEYEKFLFYRGIGSFPLPLKVRPINDDTFEITNKPVMGVEAPLGRMIILEVAEDPSNPKKRVGSTRLPLARMKTIGGMQPNSVEQFKMPSKFTNSKAVSGKIRRVLRKALIEAGLYEKEARSFVRTWEPSYFETSGIRVLYLVPRKVTDKLLPLKIKPQPKETIRVLVGRAEVVNKTMEKTIDVKIQSLDAQAFTSKKAAETALSEWGRFTLAKLRIAMLRSRDEKVRKSAARLLRMLIPGVATPPYL